MLREYTTPQSAPFTFDNTTIYSLLKRRVERNPLDIVAEYQPTGYKTWKSVTAEEMNNAVRAAAKGLIALGIHKGDTVVVYAATHYCWGVIDFACAAIGAVTVPIYETDSALQAKMIIDSVNPRIAFADTTSRALVLEEIRQKEQLEHGDDAMLEYVFNFELQELKALSDWGVSVNDETLQQHIDDVHADDLLTIVYTSGSTGKPKGVMISHRNYAHIVLAGFEFLPDMLGNPNRLLLFLPLAHCFARYVQYSAIGGHGVVGYISSASHLLADLRSFKPSYLLGVPRVFEKVYNAASQKAGNGIKGRIFAQAFEHFTHWSRTLEAGETPTTAEKIQHAFFEKTIGQGIRSAVGPNMKYLACGGAPINEDLAHFFNGIDGLTFIQGYGLTETAAPCCVNQEEANRIGTVGHPGTGISVKLLDDDELLIKGENVFMGYYNNPEQTHEAIDAEGWFHTGDLASIDDDGYVTITGRKKDIIITAGGKNVTPAPLEDTIMTCPIVQHAVVIGEGRPFIAALITLEEDMLHSWLQSQNLNPEMSFAEAAKNDAVHAYIQQFVDKANLHVSRAESIRKFAVLPTQFSQDNRTLTPSFKVIRKNVLKTFADVINNEIYTVKPGSQPPAATSTVLLSKANDVTANMNTEFKQTVTPFIEKTAEKMVEKAKMTPLSKFMSADDSVENSSTDCTSEENDNGGEEHDHAHEA